MVTRKQVKAIKAKQFAVTRRHGIGDETSFTIERIRAEDHGSALKKALLANKKGEVVGLIPITSPASKFPSINVLKSRLAKGKSLKKRNAITI